MVEHIDMAVVAVAREWAEAAAEGRVEGWWDWTHPDLRLSLLQWCVVDDYLEMDAEERDDLAGWLVRLARASWRPGTQLDGPLASIREMAAEAVPEWWIEDWNVASGRRVTPEGLEVVAFMRPETYEPGGVEEDTIISMWPVLVSKGAKLAVRGTGSYWAPIPGWPPTTKEPTDVVDR